VLANAFVNTAWRNGPVEDIHAGDFRGYPVEQRRMTPAEERALMAFASERFAQAMSVCLRFLAEQSPRGWVEQVLPYGLAEPLLITPSGWTLTEISRDVRLPWMLVPSCSRDERPRAQPELELEPDATPRRPPGLEN
jgi:hypothetical protein